MAQLPPDGEWLIQQIDGYVILFHRHTEEEVTRFRAGDKNEAGIAQGVIHADPRLTEEQKSMAHFWCGYFYAHASHQ